MCSTHLLLEEFAAVGIGAGDRAALAIMRLGVVFSPMDFLLASHDQHNACKKQSNKCAGVDNGMDLGALTVTFNGFVDIHGEVSRNDFARDIV